MRKTFLTFCVAVLSLFAVSSCYDDSSLWTEIDNLKDKVAALEAKINEQVETLNNTIGALDAKVAVVKVEKNAAGNYVLTFSNSETLEISAADANANNTGLVTTVTEDGVTYWAVVGADGKVTKLDAVVHPDTKLLFKVDSETGLLQVSYDGKNYESTGVFVNDETTFNVVQNFVDAEDHVVITVGGVEYKLPKVSVNRFEIVSGMQYFAYNEWGEPETKVIPVDMAGIVSYMVAKAPAGWTVKLSDKGLEVTAPYEDDYEADQSGVIEIWVVTEDGQTKVSSVKVSVGATPATFAFANNFEDVNVTFGVNDMIYFGVSKAGEYDADEVVTKVLESQYELAEGVFANGEDPQTGNYNLTGEYKFADLLGSAPVAGETYTFWSVIPTFETDWTAWPPISTMKVAAEDIVLNDVTVYTVTVKSEATFKDAALDVAVAGVDKYYLGFIEMSYSNQFYNYLNPEDLASSLVELEVMMSYQGMTFWELITEGFNMMMMPGAANSMLAEGKVLDASYKGNLSDFVNCVPGTEYAVILLPIEAGKTGADYTAADYAVLDPIKLPALQYDGTATVTFAEAATEVTSSSFNLAVESTGDRVYYAVTGAGEFDTTNPDLIMDLVEGFLSFFTAADEKSFVIKAEKTVWGEPLMPGTEYDVVAFAVSSDGKCSNAVSKTVKTAEFEYSKVVSVTDVKVAVVEGDYDPLASVTFTVSGDAKAIYYYMTSVTNWQGDPAFPDAVEDPDGYAAYLKRIVYSTFDPSETTIFAHREALTSENFKDGKVTITGGTPDEYGVYPLEIGNSHPRVIFAFAEDAEGKFSPVVKSAEFSTADMGE